jgi:hypothetical protein
MSIEERLAILEKEVAELKRGKVQDKGNWIRKISGSFKDDPEFGEILRLGREIREAEKESRGGDA